MERELEPFQLVSVIRLTKRAASFKMKHIPKFKEFLSNEGLLLIKTDTEDNCLSDLLLDRALMATKGAMIIRSLL